MDLKDQPTRMCCLKSAEGCLVLMEFEEHCELAPSGHGMAVTLMNSQQVGCLNKDQDSYHHSGMDT